MMVLCYHKVGDTKKDWDGVVTSRGTFIKQLSYLKENYGFISPAEALSKTSSKGVLLTFDDGAEDNYLNVLPIIEELEVPALFFVMTETLERKCETWINELIWLFMEGNEYPPYIVLEIEGMVYEYATSTSEERTRAYCEILKKLVGSSLQTRDNVMEVIRKWAEKERRVGRMSHLMLSRNQLKEMSESRYVTIGCHTVTHRSLGKLDYQEQYNEINSSKKVLESIIEKKIEQFAYPFGGPTDYDVSTIEILKDLEFRCAYSTTYKRKSLSFSQYEIPRVCINECSMDDFIAKFDFYKNKESYYYSVF